MAKSLLTILLLMSFGFESPALPSGFSAFCRNSVGRMFSSVTHFRNRPWYEKIDFSEAERVLKNEEIIDMVPLKKYMAVKGKKVNSANEVYVVTLKGGTLAVFKPGAWIAEGEYSGYVISTLMGIKKVGPTVIREINGRMGSLQYFVETGKSKNRARGEDWSDTLAYWFLSGQYDDHGDNFAVDKSGTSVLFDNSGVLNVQQVRYGEYPYLLVSDKVISSLEHPEMQWTDDFPFDNHLTLAQPTQAGIRDRFKSDIGSGFIGNILEYYKSHFGRGTDDGLHYVYWKGGLWIRWDRPRWYPKAFTARFSQTVLTSVAKWNFGMLRSRLPPLYSDQLIELLLERRDQLLRAQESYNLPPFD